MSSPRVECTQGPGPGEGSGSGPGPGPDARAVAAAPIASSAEAEALLVAALTPGSGAAAPAPGSAVAAALGALSPLEREALAASTQHLETALLRRVAAARLQLEQGLEATRRGWLAVELAQALLGEIDELRRRLRAPTADLALAAERKVLAKELVERGMELSLAVSQQVTAAVALPTEPFGLPAVSPSLLAVEAEPPTPPDRPRRSASAGLAFLARNRALAVLLGCGVLALGYHGWRLAAWRPAALPASVPGAPTHTFVVRVGPDEFLLKTLAGRDVDADELARFEQLEAARGRSLRSLGRGVWLDGPQRPASAEARAPSSGSRSTP